jgi:hypothetical protein
MSYYTVANWRQDHDGKVTVTLEGSDYPPVWGGGKVLLTAADEATAIQIVLAALERA